MENHKQMHPSRMRNRKNQTKQQTLWKFHPKEGQQLLRATILARTLCSLRFVLRDSSSLYIFVLTFFLYNYQIVYCSFVPHVGGTCVGRDDQVFTPSSSKRVIPANSEGEGHVHQRRQRLYCKILTARARRARSSATSLLQGSARCSTAAGSYICMMIQRTRSSRNVKMQSFTMRKQRNQP